MIFAYGSCREGLVGLGARSRFLVLTKDFGASSSKVSAAPCLCDGSAFLAERR